MSGVEFSPVGPSNAAPRALLGTGTTHAGVDGLKDNGHRVDGILPAWAWPRKLSPPFASFTTQPEPAEAAVLARQNRARAPSRRAKTSLHPSEARGW
jgi:hypothetical protein